jgi:mRNA-degrading endonuclease RelE of RelBE toxin-antitoxin system
MSNVKIEFRRDVEVDLNAYFEAFSRPLRKQIEDELFKLLGGAPKTAKTKKDGRMANYQSVRASDKLSLNPQAPPRRTGTKSAVILAHIQRTHQGNAFTLAEFTHLLEQNGVAGRPSTWAGNLVRSRQLRVVT